MVTAEGPPSRQREQSLINIILELRQQRLTQFIRRFESNVVHFMTLYVSPSIRHPVLGPVNGRGNIRWVMLAYRFGHQLFIDDEDLLFIDRIAFCRAAKAEAEDWLSKA